MYHRKLLHVLLILCLGAVIAGCKVIPSDLADCSICTTEAVVEEIDVTPPDPTCEPPEPSTKGAVPKLMQVTAGLPKPEFLLQRNSPAYIANFFPLACSWQGVSGQVFDLLGNPIQNMVVTVGGWLNGVEIDKYSLTGTSPAFGPGGFEVHLGTQPATSVNGLWIQISDLSGQVLSQPYSFNTYADCERNLIIMNFYQTGPYKVFLSSISN